MNCACLVLVGSRAARDVTASTRVVSVGSESLLQGDVFSKAARGLHVCLA